VVRVERGGGGVVGEGAGVGDGGIGEVGDGSAGFGEGGVRNIDFESRPGCTCLSSSLTILIDVVVHSSSPPRCHRRLLGDRDALLRLLLDAELSRLLCSSSFRFPLSFALDANGPEPLVSPDFAADTNSRGPFDFDCSFALRICFCDALSSSAYAHGGNAVGTAASSDNDDAYCSSSLMPAKSISLGRWPGSRRTDEASSRWLKCWPFDFNSKNCANFFVAFSGGEPGGEGGMSKLGTVGSVRFCISARLDVYGEPGGASLSASSSGGGGATVGPCEGLLTGPVDVAGCSSGTGAERGSGAGASLVRMFVNSILVAILVFPAHLRDLHLPCLVGSRPRRRYSRN